ncbi:LysR substrate-binding domain-containing protein, partial [Streptococcus agalactiae]|uniref:LysR substrate-binding domain-containing protein n=1 Tax=Streptococcus agalactiae TaxID=1311 RepID=UPI002553F4D7
ENLLEIWDDISEEVINSGSVISGKLKIGLVESHCSIIVERVIQELQDLHPKLQFELYSAYSDDLKAALDMMQIDCAI